MHKRYDELLKRIINDREELRKTTKINEEGIMEEKARDFLDMILLG